MGRPFTFGQWGVATPVRDKGVGGRRQKQPCTPHTVEVGSRLRALSDAALLVDEGGRIIDLNEAAEKLIARPRGELVGAAAERLLGTWVGTQPGGQPSALTRALGGEWVHGGRQQFRTAGGNSFPVTVGICPVRDTCGKVAGALLNIKDVTEVAQLQGELEKGERHLAVGEMTAGLVHDFNNVLSTISEAVSVLETDHKTSEREQTVLGIINHSVRQGAETVSNIRKYLTGKRAQSAPVDVRQLLDEVLEFTNPVLNTHKGLTVVRDTQPCADVQANPDELRRAFTNLVMNAVEAMPERGTLTVSCRQAPGRVQVSVRDTGTGIPPEIQKRIFSAYFTTKAKGTGLGLAGARRAIEAQGGDIRFESSPGRGTTFFVTLPSSAGGQAGSNGTAAERKVS